MSAPTPVPPPPSYYRPRPRSIFGPLVLITLGVIFLLRTTGVIGGEKLRYWFAHYWPLLLILWGVAKLAEHLWARYRGEPTPRLGAGGVVFLVFFIMIASGVTATSDWDWGKLNWNFDGDFDPFNNRYEFTDNFAQPLAVGAQVKVLCNRGDINVTPSDDNQAHVVLHKVVRTNSQESANRTNDSTHAQLTQQGSTWLLDLTGGDYDRVQFNVDLQLPRPVPVALSTNRGKLSVSQRDGNADLSTRAGDASVEELKGDAAFHIRSGSVTARNVTGNVQIEGVLHDGVISDIGGTLDFDVRYFTGDVQLSHLAKSFHIKSLTIDMQSARLDGDMSMRHGDVRGKALSGPIKLNTHSNEVHLEEVSGAVQVENRNGVVELQAKAPLGNIDINNVNSGIELELPQNAKFHLDAESRDGNIEVSDFPLSVDNNRRDASARGSVGQGGPDIRLRSSRGTIQIRKE
jgi:DUF4097 and DUF4098 domain-containing protein YvlB